MKHLELTNKNKRIIGYQIVSKDDNCNIPDEFFSFQIMSKKDAKRWIKENDTAGEWEIEAIEDGGIEDPTFIRVY
jgi:hypothetical protein